MSIADAVRDFFHCPMDELKLQRKCWEDYYKMQSLMARMESEMEDARGRAAALLLTSGRILSAARILVSRTKAGGDHAADIDTLLTEADRVVGDWERETAFLSKREPELAERRANLKQLGLRIREKDHELTSRLRRDAASHRAAEAGVPASSHAAPAYGMDVLSREARLVDLIGSTKPPCGRA